MKAKIIDLPKIKSGRPKAELPMPLLLAYRAQGLTLRDISSRTGIPLSTLGETLKGKLTSKLIKARQRRARRKRRTRMEI
jgi:predicted transcriptional regulator